MQSLSAIQGQKMGSEMTPAQTQLKRKKEQFDKVHLHTHTQILVQCLVLSGNTHGNAFALSTTNSTGASAYKC